MPYSPENSQLEVGFEGADSQPQQEWEENFDDTSQHPYWYNTTTQESTWENPHPLALLVDESKQAEDAEADKHEVDLDPGGVTLALSYFECPPMVPRRWTDFGNKVLFHGVKDPSPFFRINVFSAENPKREAFKPTNNVDLKVWSTKIVMYAFSREMPNTVYYDITYSMNPFRTRLLPQKLASQAKRDISRWNKSRKEEECGFWAFPLQVPGSEMFYVDWTSSPDRYSITTKPTPEWQWTRCFSFFAYTASKFHVLECLDPLCYKVVEGHVLGDSVGLDEWGQQWNCIMAFFAFTTQVPGTNCYYVQEQFEPHYRTRVGMEPSYRGWTDNTKFYAFDTAMPGTSKLSVQYTTQSIEAYTLTAEQVRRNVFVL